MRRAIAVGTTLAAVVAGLTVFLTSSAAADPSSSAWASLRQCESSGNYSIDTGNGYYGAYQFDLSTWRSVGGSGSPANASAGEQDYRALYLYRMRGWAPWTCASLVGLREDSSARSGRVPTLADSAYMGHGAAPVSHPAPGPNCAIGNPVAPAWGGTTMVPGGSYQALVCWQKQMAHRGYAFVGTGYFGVHTLAAAHDLQRKSGLPQGNAIDARTWSAAWARPVVVPPKPVPGPGVWPGLTAPACHVGSRTAPAWPGVSFSLGSSNKNLACWQMQMGHRGYNLRGVGYYGANTLAAAKDIQLRNGLGGSGLIGPNTWKAAWEGKARV